MSASADRLPPYFVVLPTRVRRNYTGGAMLERWTGSGNGADGDMPEDWIASTTLAKNPGLPARRDEGITRVQSPDGAESDLRTEIARHPLHLLGADHLAAVGTEIGFLAKLLDSSIRLHVQAHPTAAFSRAHLDSPYGKLETYVILGARPGVEPYAFLGFSDAPSPDEWRRIIAEQDLSAMHARLNRVPLRAGEVWLVPGGLPHAIGEGVLMLEVMEPSDWVVRCEFVREGIVVPPEGRYMGRDLDFCLQIFDYRSYRPDEIRATCRLAPRRITDSSNATEDELVGGAQTDRFVIRRFRATAPAAIPNAGRFRLMLITSGSGTLECGAATQPLKPGARLLIPAGSSECRLVPTSQEPLEAVFCLPGNS